VTVAVFEVIIGYLSRMPIRANNYLYCWNNPINHIDPLGLAGNTGEYTKVTDGIIDEGKGNLIDVAENHRNRSNDSTLIGAAKNMKQSLQTTVNMGKKKLKSNAKKPVWGIGKQKSIAVGTAKDTKDIVDKGLEGGVIFDFVFETEGGHQLEEFINPKSKSTETQVNEEKTVAFEDQTQKIEGGMIDKARTTIKEGMETTALVGLVVSKKGTDAGDFICEVGYTGGKGFVDGLILAKDMVHALITSSYEPITGIPDVPAPKDPMDDI
jgi:hypothetical protein